MKRHFLLLAVMCVSLSLMAEKYTIVFNSGNADSTSETDELNNIVLSATDNCVASIINASKIYRAKEGYGIKGGTGTSGASISIGLDDTYMISKLTVYAAAFASKDDTTSTKTYTRGIVIMGKYFDWESGHKTELYPYSYTLNTAVNSITVASNCDSKNRWYVQKIEFEAENPHPAKAILGMQYATLSLGSIAWESEDEPMEDAIGFEVVGKNIKGDISLSLKNGKKFSITPSSLSANGGEASVAYSILMSSAPDKAIPYIDTVIATAKGNDNILYTRKLPVELTIKPKSSGASTFALDTTRMAIGPMAGNYYQYAQNTADSTLKNHLGYIICCGKRYKYGSGTKKTWDAFFYTDRNPVTNQVLDMYSNNVRYFNPDKPTASVSDFDIEHMLPKSWWGGDVNPAYCDLFHLVPGDYSANRSKSNHAPGIPSDSTFNNGSFVTGSGAAYGLTRVFCPEDQYKGDFARAYFYIAACYGDSLTWLTSGEPAVAMTNEGWQEFRPWLRDLLLDWHRMDPVSDKEKTRAIEVNKIQGNRNPFIDYPDLVEYIWGSKQGVPVDFRVLTQSYGDSYDESGTGTGICDIATDVPVAHKELRNGQLVIIRNSAVFSTSGQLIR